MPGDAGARKNVDILLLFSSAHSRPFRLVTAPAIHFSLCTARFFSIHRSRTFSTPSSSRRCLDAIPLVEYCSVSIMARVAFGSPHTSPAHLNRRLSSIAAILDSRCIRCPFDNRFANILRETFKRHVDILFTYGKRSRNEYRYEKTSVNVRRKTFSRVTCEVGRIRRYRLPSPGDGT